MAHGSAAEVQCHFYVALDMNYINKEDFEILYQKADEVSKMIQGFMNYLNNSQNSLTLKLSNSNHYAACNQHLRLLSSKER